MWSKILEFVNIGGNSIISPCMCTAPITPPSTPNNEKLFSLTIKSMYITDITDTAAHTHTQMRTALNSFDITKF